jgi:hypothetical protein
MVWPTSVVGVKPVLRVAAKLVGTGARCGAVSRTVGRVSSTAHFASRIPEIPVAWLL